MQYLMGSSQAYFYIWFYFPSPSFSVTEILSNWTLFCATVGEELAAKLNILQLISKNSMGYYLFVYFMFHISEFSIWGMWELCQLIRQTAGSPKLICITKTCTWCLSSLQTGTICVKNPKIGNGGRCIQQRLPASSFGCEILTALISQTDGRYQ